MILLLLILGCAGDVELLLSELDSVNPAVRQAAVVDARSLDDARVVAALEQLLSDPDRQVRLDAMLSLDALPSGVKPATLSPLMSDKDPKMARAAIDAMGRLQNAGGAPGLIALLNSNPETPPLNAIWALGQTGAPEAVPVLAELRKHPNEFVSYNADQALRDLD